MQVKYRCITVYTVWQYNPSRNGHHQIFEAHCHCFSK